MEAGGFCRILTVSPFYKTAPVDYTDQEWFVNGVARIETDLDPFALLALLKSIEKEMGRKPTVRFGPRVLDLDIIFYEEEVFNTPKLTLPHPRMDQRRFVLQPLCDIDPDLVHPVIGKSVQEMLEDLIEKTLEDQPGYQEVLPL